MLKTNIYFFVCLALILLSGEAFSQEANIVPYLKQIERGDLRDAKDGLLQLKNKNPNDPSVMFLDGVLTQNARDAVEIYKTIINKYPGSKYADAALYRIYTYYYALGSYDTANSYLERLRAGYPSSPYLKIISQNIQYDSSKTDEKLTENETTIDTSSVTKEPPAVGTKENIFKYTIQAGAFSNKDNALSLQKDFVNAGYFSIIKDKSVAGSTFQVVYVGKFTNEEDAKNILQEIETKFKITGQVIPIEQSMN